MSAPRSARGTVLPATIRAAVARLLESGQQPDAIVHHLQALGAEANEPARGAAGLAVLAGRLREARETAEALADGLTAEGASLAFHVNVELLHAALAQLMLGSGGATLDPNAVHVLARTLDLVTRARLADGELIRKLREAADRLASQQASGPAKAGTQPRGLSEATIRTIKARILGIRDDE
jgi:hypothetical protein